MLDPLRWHHRDACKASKLFQGRQPINTSKTQSFQSIKKAGAFQFDESLNLLDDIILSKSPVVFKTSKNDKIPSMHQKLQIFAKCQISLQILAKHQNILCTGTADEAGGGTIIIIINLNQSPYVNEDIFYFCFIVAVPSHSTLYMSSKVCMLNKIRIQTAYRCPSIF